MQLYDDVSSFADSLAAFFDVALRRGDATCIAATDDVTDALRTRLRARGWEIGGSSGHPRCLALNVHDALDRFMRNRRPDPELLASLAAELNQFRLAVTDSPSSRLTLFANTDVPLITSGNTEGAIALEQQWNLLTHDLPFFLLCGYPTLCFHDGSDDRWSRACAEHWAVSQASDL
jgi:hypothetical protein